MYLIFGAFLTLALLCCCPYLFLDASAGNTFKSLQMNKSAPVANVTIKPKVNAVSATTFHNKVIELVLFNDSKASESSNRKSLDALNAMRLAYITDKQPQVAKQQQQQQQQQQEMKRQLTGSGTSRNSSVALTGKQLFGDQAASSLFRPSFLKDLLGNRKNGQSGDESNGGEEEEEVTQTIVMPMSKLEEKRLRHQQQQQQHIGSLRGSASQPGMTHHTQFMKQPPLMYAASMHSGPHNQRIHKEIQPKPEASLQLTSTEMNSILNDREAPEFYREREFNGEGVMVGEEQPRLRAAASTGMGGYGSGGGFGSGGMSGGFGGDSDAFAHQRLVQAGSEDPSSFNHRFGSQGFGSGGDELSAMGPHSGRLMQSPAEFNEMGAPGGYGGGSASGYGGGDFGPNSGLLRAGSGEFNGDTSEGASFEGGFGASGGGGGGFGGASGYPNSPMLERHASELYGGAGNSGAGGGGYSGNQFEFGPQAGRMFAAGSYNPNNFAASQVRYTGAGSDEYSSRFGAAFNQRGFTNQNNMMLRGNSMLTNSMHDSGRLGGSELSSGSFGSDLGGNPNGGVGSGSGGGNKLLPLSPVIPVAEDVSATNYREMSSSSSSASEQQLPGRFRQSSAPQVHESLEDDPSDSSDPSETDSANGQQYEASTNNDQSEGGHLSGEGHMNGGGVVGDESTTSNNYEMQARAAKADQANEQANLVLNVPPPNIDNSLQSSTNGHRNMAVEFSRVGSAGYLAPGHSNQDSSMGPQFKLRQKIIKKTSGFLNQQPHHSRHHNQQQQDRPEYDPAENPAHTGKYIID